MNTQLDLESTTTLFFSGNDQLDKLMYDEASWVSGSGVHYLTTTQQSLAVLMKVLSLKSHVSGPNEMSPLEQLVFAQNKQRDPLKVVPKITSYINHVFNGNLAMLSCRLLNRFAAVSCFFLNFYHIKKKSQILHCHLRAYLYILFGSDCSPVKDGQRDRYSS